MKKMDFFFILMLLSAFAIAVMSRQLSKVVAYLHYYKWAVLAVFIIYLIWRTKFRIEIPRGRVAHLFLLFLIVAMISSFRRVEHLDEAIVRIFSFSSLFIIPWLFLLPRDDFVRLETWSNAVKLITFSIVVCSFLRLISPFGYAGGRLLGITSNPNTLGTYSSMMLVIIFAQYLTTKGPRKLFYLISFMIPSITLILSQSRAATIGALAGILSLGYVQKKWYSFGLAISLLLFIFFLPPVVEYYSPRGRERFINMANREHVFRAQFQAWQESPIIGQGLAKGNPEKGTTGRPGGEASFSDLLASVGLIGFIGFFGAIFFGVKYFIDYILIMKKEFPLSNKIPILLASFAIIIVIIFNSIFEGFLSGVGDLQAIYFWVVLGCVDNLNLGLQMRRKYKYISHCRISH